MALDELALRTVVAKQASRILVKTIRPLVKLDFEQKKEQFLEAFDSDPVSEEIAAGPFAYSQVPALAQAGGNLFSLLGFHAEQKPIESLREFLQDNIVLYKTSAGRVEGDRIVFETTVLGPTEGEINSVAASDPEMKVDWSSESFTSLLDGGIAGLPQYLFDLTRDFSQIPSRSGPAIQTKNDLRDAEMPSIDYVRRLLRVLKRTMTPRG